MAAVTTNLGLIVPELADKIGESIPQIGENFEKIDAAMEENLAAQKDLINQAIDNINTSPMVCMRDTDGGYITTSDTISLEDWEVGDVAYGTELTKEYAIDYQFNLDGLQDELRIKPDGGWSCKDGGGNGTNMSVSIYDENGIINHSADIACAGITAAGTIIFDKDMVKYIYENNPKINIRLTFVQKVSLQSKLYDVHSSVSLIIGKAQRYTLPYIK